MMERPVLAAALQASPKQEGQAGLLSFQAIEKHLIVVGVNALVRFSVQIKQRFKAGIEAAAGLAKVKQANDRAAPLAGSNSTFFSAHK